MESIRNLVFVLLGVGGLVYGSSSGDAGAQAVTQKKRVIETGEIQRLTSKAGVPISVAVADDTYVYVSALAPFDLEAGSMVEGSIEDQAEQVLKNLETVLKAAGVVSRGWWKLARRGSGAAWWWVSGGEVKGTG